MADKKSRHKTNKQRGVYIRILMDARTKALENTPSAVYLDELFSAIEHEDPNEAEIEDVLNRIATALSDEQYRSLFQRMLRYKLEMSQSGEARTSVLSSIREICEDAAPLIMPKFEAHFDSITCEAISRARFLATQSRGDLMIEASTFSSSAKADAEPSFEDASEEEDDFLKLMQSVTQTAKDGESSPEKKEVGLDLHKQLTSLPAWSIPPAVRKKKSVKIAANTYRLPPRNSSNKVYIGNLPHIINEEDLIKALAHIGEVDRVELFRDRELVSHHQQTIVRMKKNEGQVLPALEEEETKEDVLIEVEGDEVDDMEDALGDEIEEVLAHTEEEAEEALEGRQELEEVPAEDIPKLTYRERLKMERPKSDHHFTKRLSTRRKPRSESTGVYALVHFKNSEGVKKALSPPLRLFGLHLKCVSTDEERRCKIFESTMAQIDTVEERTSLRLSNISFGLPTAMLMHNLRRKLEDIVELNLDPTDVAPGKLISSGKAVIRFDSHELAYQAYKILSTDFTLGRKKIAVGFAEKESKMYGRNASLGLHDARMPDYAPASLNLGQAPDW